MSEWTATCQLELQLLRMDYGCIRTRTEVMNNQTRNSRNVLIHYACINLEVKTVSIVLVSASLPEEEEEFQESSLNDTQGSGDSSKIKWTPMSVNSHLHHSRATPTENMADLRLSGSKR